MSAPPAEEVYVRVSDVLPWLRHADDCNLPMLDVCTCGIGDIPTFPAPSDTTPRPEEEP